MVQFEAQISGATTAGTPGLKGSGAILGFGTDTIMHSLRFGHERAGTISIIPC